MENGTWQSIIASLHFPAIRFHYDGAEMFKASEQTKKLLSFGMASAVFSLRWKMVRKTMIDWWIPQAERNLIFLSWGMHCYGLDRHNAL